MSPESIGFYGRLARWVLRNRVPTAVGVLLALVLSLVGASQLEIDQNLMAMLPEGDPTTLALEELHAQSGGVNLVTVSLRPTGEDADLDGFIDRAEQALSDLDTVEFAVHSIDEDLAAELALLQLSPKEIEELTVRLRGALALGPALNPLVTQRLMDMGPLTERIAQAGSPDALGMSDDVARIFIKPRGSSHDRAFAEALMSGIDDTLFELAPGKSGIEVAWVGGPYRHLVEDIKGIRRDTTRTSITSALLVLLVISLTFRSVRSVVLVATPLLVANVFMLGFAWLSIGFLNSYTSFGTAILIGLGIDFAVHLVGRYREIRAEGLDVETSIIRAWDLTGPPCTTAALTSSAGFLALSLASFRGFGQLGQVLAVGLMSCLVAMLVMLPLLIPLLDRSPKPLLGARTGPAAQSTSTYRFSPVGLVVAGVVTLAVATLLPRLSFEYDFSALRQDGLRYEELTEADRKLASDSFSPVALIYPDAEARRAGYQRLEAAFTAGELPHIARLVSVDALLPADQDRRLEALALLQAQLSNPSMRYLPPPVVKNLLPLKGRSLEPLAESDLPDELLTLLGASKGQYWVLAFPDGNMWDMRENRVLRDELGAKLDGEQMVGEYIMLASLFETLQRDYPMVTVIALLLVLLLTILDLRRAAAVVGAMGTLLAGLVWAGGALVAFGVPLNIVNVVGVPILLGIGIDVVIHLLHRLDEEGPGGVRRALSTTGVAATISTLTTVLSFSSLTLAGNRGVRSLGMLVVVGLCVVFLATAGLLPLAWSARWRLRGEQPGED